jgi:hypothetical protein
MSAVTPAPDDGSKPAIVRTTVGLVVAMARNLSESVKLANSFRKGISYSQKDKISAQIIESASNTCRSSLTD